MRADNYGKQTLAFVEKVRASETMDCIWQMMLAEMRWYGLDFVTIWSVPSVEESLAETVVYNTRPEDYIKYYSEHDYVSIDPVVGAMRETMCSLSWSDVRSRKPLTGTEKRIIDEGRDFGATDGLTIPIVTASGFAGVVSPCGYKPDLSPRARDALELVGLYAHQALRRASRRDVRRAQLRKPLTLREREVMRWVAIGKTNDEIGVILNIGASTVKTILARAQEKLDATRRTFAVVQALRFGELDLNF